MNSDIRSWHLDSLSVIAWGCGASKPDLETLQSVQKAAGECWSRGQRLNLPCPDAAQHMLTITWACSFAGCLTATFHSFVHKHMLKMGRSMDADASHNAWVQSDREEEELGTTTNEYEDAASDRR